MSGGSRIRRTTPLLLTALALLLCAAPAIATPSPDAPKKALVVRQIDGLAGAISRAGQLPAPLRARLAATTRSSTRGLKPKNACRAFGRLRGVQNAIAKRAGRRVSLVKLAARVSRARNLLLLFRPARKGCGGPATVAVDPGLKPVAKALPKMRGAKRPLARVEGSNGDGADFVADEIVVMATRGELKPILRRLRGVLLKTVDVPGDPADIHLIRIRRPGKVAGLASDVGRLSKTKGTSTLVSSQQGLGTLAAVADEAARGGDVGINWIGAGDSFVDGSTRDAAAGPERFSVLSGGWSSNAYNWVQMAGSGPQNTGVAPSWTLLAKLNRLQPSSIRVGILDMGFATRTNGDMQPDMIARSNVPGADAIGTKNLLGCGGGNPCLWHGTAVHNAAMGVADNGIGAAGPAGPVARPVLVFTLYDFFTSMSATLIGAAEGARVLNMSYSADVPAAFSWSVAPFELTTAAIRAGGVLLFAAAGNSAQDVDATDCFVFCWEETLHTPCENVGVICVGATDRIGVAPACYSNWGSDGAVDLWAPGTVLVGGAPDTSGGVQATNGTSVASPFAAGVTALAWAGSPSASANQVERAVRDHTRRGDSGDKNCKGNDVDRHTANRFIDGLATIKDLLPRDVEIRQPADGTTVRRGAPLSFEGFVYDDDRGAATLSWTRSGSPTPIGTTATFSKIDLPAGTHDITLTATFPGGETQTDQVRVTITNDAPRVEITSPADGASFFKAQTATFRGQSVDINEPGLTLADSQVSWHLDGNPTPFATGHTVMRAMSDLAAGPHTITLRGSDGVETAEASITITVQNNPLDLPPTVTINTPTASQQFFVTGNDGGGDFANVAFNTTASDPELDPLTYSWSDRINNGAPQALATVLADPTLKLYWQHPDPCSDSQHDVTVTVSDGTTTASDTVRVFIDRGPC